MMDTASATSMDRSPGRSALRWLVALGLAAAVGLLLASLFLAAGSAAGHAQLHAITGLAALVPAGTLVARVDRPTMASRAPAIGLWLLAATQMIEGLGALGYGADGYTRANGLVALHDLGLGLAPIGLVGAAVGVAAGIGTLVGRRSNRPRVAAGVTVLAALVALVVVAKMIGL
jgi:hypothetical protein